MDLTRPGGFVLTEGTQAVLAVLAGTDRLLTGREVARLAELSHHGAQRVLARLVEQGVVYAEPAGRALQYSLNRRHLLAGPLLRLIGAREDLVERLESAIQGWRLPAHHASLFGSAARGDGGIDSDIDVLVVRPDEVVPDDERWRVQLDEVAESAYAWTGNRLAWLELSQADVTAALSSSEPIVENWRTESVTLAGVAVEELLRAAGADRARCGG